MWPLVHEKLGKFIDQGIIIPVKEPINWASSLAYSWKANGKLRVCLDPKDLNTAIRHDHYKTPTVEDITHELAWSTCFTKLDRTLILPVHSPWLWVITAHGLQHTMGKVQICPPPLRPSLCTRHLPMVDVPDPCPLRWSDRHHRQCSCSWKGLKGTWQTSPQIH